MSRRKQLPTTHRLAFGPDFANSSRFHSAPFQRQPVNRSTGPHFHSTPLHRLKSSKTGCPGATRAAAFAKSPHPASRASGPCRNFRPHRAPQIQSDLCRPGNPLASRLPSIHQATAPVSPGRQKSEHRGPAPIEPPHQPALPFPRHSTVSNRQRQLAPAP